MGSNIKFIAVISIFLHTEFMRKLSMNFFLLGCFLTLTLGVGCGTNTKGRSRQPKIPPINEKEVPTRFCAAVEKARIRCKMDIMPHVTHKDCLDHVPELIRNPSDLQITIDQTHCYEKEICGNQLIRCLNKAVPGDL